MNADVEGSLTFDFRFVPGEVPLDRAPLVRVLCQVRFAREPELVDDTTERAIARELRESYPVRGAAQGTLLPIPALETLMGKAAESFRTFESQEGTWKVTVAADFVSLETSSYESRDDFLSRLSDLLVAIERVWRPARVLRVGLRYTDRIERPEGLVNLVHRSLLGLLPELTDPDTLTNQLLHTLLVDSETETQVQVGSLCLPPGVSFDGAIQPVPVDSWVLDIDASADSPNTFSEAELVARVRVLAERAYQVFHWAVTDEFRAKYGSQEIPAGGVQ